MRLERDKIGSVNAVSGDILERYLRSVETGELVSGQLTQRKRGIVQILTKAVKFDTRRRAAALSFRARLDKSQVGMLPPRRLSELALNARRHTVVCIREFMR